jgi:hypothetical protein
MRRVADGKKIALQTAKIGFQDVERVLFKHAKLLENKAQM